MGKIQNDNIGKTVKKWTGLSIIVICLTYTVIYWLRPENAVYIGDTSIPENLQNAGINKKTITKALKKSLVSIYDEAIQNRIKPIGSLSDTSSVPLYSISKISLNGKGDLGLHTGKLAPLEYLFRKLTRRNNAELYLTLSGDTTRISVNAIAYHRNDTLFYMQSEGYGKNLQETLSLSLEEVARQICMKTNPLAAVFIKDLKNEKITTDKSDLQSQITRAYIRELVENNLDTINAYLNSGNKLRKIWGKLLLGDIYNETGYYMDDTSALHTAALFYEQIPQPGDIPLPEIAKREAVLSKRMAETAPDINAFIKNFEDKHIQIPDSCQQLILVYNEKPEHVLCALRRFEKKNGEGWKETCPMIHCSVGKAGIAPYGEKREGDKRTPSGCYPMGIAFGAEKDFDMDWPYLVLTPDHYWISDPEDSMYNRLVNGKPKTDNFEHLIDETVAYKRAAVVEYNTNPVIKHMGSAIFFHIEAEYGTGSAGCITVTEQEVVKTLKWLDPEKRPFMLIKTLQKERGN